jgi:hypothetical protein
MTFTSLIASSGTVPMPAPPVVETSVALALSMVMLLPRPRPPLALKLPWPRKGLRAETGMTPGVVPAMERTPLGRESWVRALDSTLDYICEFVVAMTMVLSSTWTSWRVAETSRTALSSRTAPVLMRARVLVTAKPGASIIVTDVEQ